MLLRLIAEYKWGDKTFGQRKENAKGCGIFVHTVGEDGTALEAWAYGIEVQIIEG